MSGGIPAHCFQPASQALMRFLCNLGGFIDSGRIQQVTYARYGCSPAAIVARDRELERAGCLTRGEIKRHGRYLATSRVTKKQYAAYKKALKEHEKNKKHRGSEHR